MNIADVKKLGALSLVNFAIKHAQKCDAHSSDDVKVRGPIVRAAARELENAYGGYRPLRALWTDACGRKERGDVGVEDVVRGLSYDLLGPALCNKNRKDTRYKVLFPNGNIDFIDGADREQVAHVRGMVAALRSDPSHPMHSRAAELETKNEAFDATLGPLVAAETAFRNAESLMRQKREDLVRVLRKSQTYLRDQLGGDEAAVNKLFPTIAESKVDEPKDDDDV